MNVTFLVMAHDDAASLQELAGALDPYRTIVHIDRPYYKELSKRGSLNSLSESFELIDEPGCVHWGAYSVHKAMMRLIEVALEDDSMEMVAFLSGQCFPLRPVQEFAEFLSSSKNVHCRAYRLDEGTGTMGYERLRRRYFLDGALGHVRKRNRTLGGGLRRAAMLLSPSKKLPETEVHAGSQWSALPRLLAEEILVCHKAGEFHYLKSAYAPDELAIPTYIHNSGWRHETQDGQALSFGGGAMSEMANFHWVRANLEGVVTDADISKALDSGQYFVRKIGTGSEADRIRQRIRAQWEW